MPGQVSPELLDPDTPDEVAIADRMPAPVDDPALGIAVAVERAGPAAHPLVVIGDSLTHGVSSAAVFRPDQAWPSMVAECLGVPAPAAPGYGGPLDGLPVNLACLLRRLEDEFGPKLDPFELVRLPFVLHGMLDAHEDWWERGAGARPPRTDRRWEALGIYGWDVRDALSATAGRSLDRIAVPAHDDLFAVRPGNDNDIAAASVLAPFGRDATQISAARWHGDHGGIGTLVVALGANNALGTVLDKQIRWSGADHAELDAKSAYNAWRPAHFAAEYAELVAAVRPITAQRVLLANVPHVTVAPIAHGVNPDQPGQKWRPGSRYFPFYTDPWIDESDFRPARHRHLTHQQARAVDSAIDQYNATVAGAVRQARRDGLDWYLLDLCGVLDGLAHRRFLADPEAAEQNGWQPLALPAPIRDLDTRFFRSGPTGRLQGGLFGLDGVHPTVCGYGIVAQAVLDVLERAGVPVERAVDFTALRTRDPLLSRPPALLNQVLGLLTPFLTRLVSRR